MQTDYRSLKDADLLLKLKPLFDARAFFIRDDGLIDHKVAIPHETPWIHTRLAPNRVCGLYHIYHQHLDIIHSRCQECWKVVVRPRTLIELHTLLELQKVLDVPSKCGIERRESVCGLYGGYFYTDSLEQGRERNAQVRKAVDKALGEDVIVLLKRGCTEFELDSDIPSDQWEVTEEQAALELRLADLINESPNKLIQPDHLRESVFRSWIEWAFSNGDLTYKEYTNGEPIFKSYVTYHEE